MSWRYMLDTDVSSYLIRGASRSLSDAFEAHADDGICISVLTVMELQYGLLNKYSDVLRDDISRFASMLDVVDWSVQAAKCCAEIMLHMKKIGRPVGVVDMQIAASAISIGAELVTNNKKHFSDIPGLKIADWT